MIDIPVRKRYIVGITGASGAIYGVRLIQCLLAEGYRVHLIISDAGWRVLKEEHGWDVSKRQYAIQQAFGELTRYVEYHLNQDIGATIASGSFRVQGMIIIPCSMGTLSSIAHGASNNLIGRAADVMMKEGWPLLIVPRETPLHAIHLKNMLKLVNMGVRIIPAMPAFYCHPKTLDDIINFFVGKVLDYLHIDHQLFIRWGNSNGSGAIQDSDRPN